MTIYPLGARQGRGPLGPMGAGRQRVGANWWDPNDTGLSVVAAYRAINSAGTPWPGGPTSYAESLVNQANPGTLDLTEGNSNVPWAAATGWSFVATAAQYFQTGIIPAATGACFVQFSNETADGVATIFGATGAIGQTWIYPNRAGLGVGYQWGAGVIQGPVIATGNLGIFALNGYRDGAFDVAIAAGAQSDIELYLGARNLVGAADRFVTVDFEAFVYYSTVPALADIQALALPPNGSMGNL